MKYHRKVGLFVSLAIVLAIIVYLFYNSWLKSLAVKKFELEYLKEENKKGMTMDSKNVRFDSVTAKSNKILQYDFTLVNDDTSSLIVSELKQNLGPIVLKAVALDSATFVLKNHRYTFIYFYKDKNGDSLFSVTVNPRDYINFFSRIDSSK